MKVIVAGLSQQEVPGEATIIFKQIPADAGDNQRCQKKRHQNSDDFFHKIAPFQENLRKLYNKSGIKSSIRKKDAVLGFLGHIEAEKILPKPTEKMLDMVCGTQYNSNTQ